MPVKLPRTTPTLATVVLVFVRGGEGRGGSRGKP